MFPSISRQDQTSGGEEDMFAIQVNVCCILKHLEVRKALSVHIYYTWCDIILIFKLHRRTRLTPRSSIGGLHVTSSKRDNANYDRFVPNFDMANKTIKRVSVLNLKSF